ncbi:MAG TPA: DUF1800 domain-containing protein [Caldimonas sp.]|jgi:uncharacterized protein (DUF1800 family)|nr:DUF1800 domain-containing protein [Caldimonas sp.]HEX2540068.1 DUF1800 domain-containing protein [Caldimonas sp.]
MALSSTLRQALAAHRFGLGEKDLEVVGSDPRGWLLAQLGPADAARGEGLLDTRQALAHVAAEREKREQARNPPPGTTAQQILADHYRDVILADARSRLATAAATRRPFAERLHLFWANHFTVSLLKGSTRGLGGAFERDAIRPHIAGRFETLLAAATTHPAMLRYLDNSQSAGPHSRVVALEARRATRRDESPRVTGINENLAREILELHTLGAEAARAGVYGQADVTAFAGVLTGWRVGLAAATIEGDLFDASWHEPGDKTVLGRRYPEGPEALRQVLHDLARHPATARFVSTKLARHFVADEPPPALVERLSRVYLDSDGQLDEVCRALVGDDRAWSAEAAKLKTPEEFVVSTARVLASGERMFERAEVANPAAGVTLMGQRLLAAPSPAGWSDRAADWLGPDAVWKRIEWATRVAERAGRSIDARKLAARSLGPLLGKETARQIERAADGSQALALFLLAPEFQRR